MVDARPAAVDNQSRRNAASRPKQIRASPTRASTGATLAGPKRLTIRLIQSLQIRGVNGKSSVLPRVVPAGLCSSSRSSLELCTLVIGIRGRRSAVAGTGSEADGAR